MGAAMVTRGRVRSLRNHILSSDKCQGTRLRNRAKIYLGERQVLNMLSPYPGSSRIAVKYHIDRLVWIQLHPEGLKLKHGALGTPGCLGVGALSESPLRRTFLVLRLELLIHPEQLLDPTSLVGQLEVVVTGVQAGKEEVGMERTQLWDGCSALHLWD